MHELYGGIWNDDTEEWIMLVERKEKKQSEEHGVTSWIDFTSSGPRESSMCDSLKWLVDQLNTDARKVLKEILDELE